MGILALQVLKGFSENTALRGQLQKIELIGKTEKRAARGEDSHKQRGKDHVKTRWLPKRIM